MKKIAVFILFLFLLSLPSSAFAADSLVYHRAIEESSIVPKGALDKAKLAIANRKELRIAFWGDSITAGADQTDPNDAYAVRVVNAIKDALPGINVVYSNYGLGGRTIYNAVNPNYTAHNPPPPDASQYWSPWAIEGQSWIGAVKSFNPDLLIAAFGMNESWSADSDELEANYLQTLIDTVKAWPSNPSIVVVPTILPTVNPAYYNQRQDITLAVARASRTIAKANGLAIADANRLFHILRDGLDDVTRATYQTVDLTDFPNWGMNTTSFTLSNGVLSPNPNVSYAFVDDKKNFYNGSMVVDVTPHYALDEGIAWVRYRYSDLGDMLVMLAGGTNGNVRLYAQQGNTTTLLKQVSNINVPLEQSTKLTIIAEGTHHQVFVNGVSMIDLNTNKVLHDGTLNIGSNAKPPSFSNLSINSSEPISSSPLYTELQLIGPYNSPQSGNGINHPTGFGHSVIYLPAFYGIIKELTK